MVIIEANIRGTKRIATFQSKDAVFYFLKSISFWASVESIVTTSVRTKIKVSAKLLILVAGQGHLKVLEIIQKVIRNFYFLQITLIFMTI